MARCGFAKPATFLRPKAPRAVADLDDPYLVVELANKDWETSGNCAGTNGAGEPRGIHWTLR